MLVSGGADSACLPPPWSTPAGPRTIAALHLNYGLRHGSDEDERAARALCAKLRIDLHVERPELGDGNLQASAREARYAAAERLRDAARSRLDRNRPHPDRPRRDGPLPARRLARHAARCSGSRARAAARSSGRCTRSRGRRRARSPRTRGLPFVDDPTNASPDYARNRIRARGPAGPRRDQPEARAQRRRDPRRAARGGRAPRRARRRGARAGPASTAAPEHRRRSGAEMSPGLRRLVLRELAERAAGRPGAAEPRPRRRDRAARRHDPEGGEVQLGDGVSAICERGMISFDRRDAGGDGRRPRRRGCQVPGSARFGDWELFAERRRRAGRTGRPRGRDARRRRPRRRARGPRLAQRRPDPPARARRHQEPAGPVHRPRRAALAAPPGAGGRRRRAGRLGRRGRGRRGVPARPRSSRDARSSVASASGARRAGLDCPAMSGRGAGASTSASARPWSTASACARRVAELGAEIDADYAGRDLVLVGVLKGALIFMADLMRALTVPCEVDFMAVSSYGSSTDSSGVVRILKDLDAPIEGRDVLIVEDIIDSGPDPPVPDAQPGGPRSRLARGLRAADQARAAPGRPADPLRRLRDPEPLRRSATGSTRAAIPQPRLRRRV